MLHKLRSALLCVLLLATAAFGLSGCVVLPYDGGYGNDRYYGNRHHHQHYNNWGHQRRW